MRKCSKDLLDYMAGLPSEKRLWRPRQYAVNIRIEEIITFSLVSTGWVQNKCFLGMRIQSQNEGYQSTIEVRKYFSMEWMAILWNYLTLAVMKSQSLSSITTEINTFTDHNKGIRLCGQEVALRRQARHDLDVMNVKSKWPYSAPMFTLLCLKSTSLGLDQTFFVCPKWFDAKYYLTVLPRNAWCDC